MKNRTQTYKLEQIFLIALLFFIYPSAGSVAYADETNNPANTTSMMKNTDGSSVQKNPDGSTLIINADGSSVEIKQDGTKIIKNTDGSSVEENPDGSKLIINSDGTRIIKSPVAPNSKQ